MCLLTYMKYPEYCLAHSNTHHRSDSIPTDLAKQLRSRQTGVEESWEMSSLGAPFTDGDTEGQARSL